MANVPTEWLEWSKVIASLIASGVHGAKETNSEECPTLTLKDFPSFGVERCLESNLSTAISWHCLYCVLDTFSVHGVFSPELAECTALFLFECSGPTRLQVLVFNRGYVELV